MFQFVKDCLEANHGESTENFPFRKRSEHIRRVFMWAEWLCEGEAYINNQVVLVSSIFDVNPMVTVKGKVFWKSKQNIMQEFIKHMSFDLGMQK